MSDTRDPNQPPASEPRAGDVIAGRVSRETLEEELDPQTIAQLAAWFGAPATGLAGQPEPDRGSRQDPELRELWERRRRATDAVDPALVARLDARTHAGDDFIRVPEPPTLTLERPLSKLDMRVWKVHLTEIRDYERPEDIPDEMMERVPQALLRDLYRPVLSWPLFFQPLDTGVDVAGQAALAEVGAVVHARYQVRMAARSMASRLAAEHMAELRARLAEPWGDIEIPEERRVQASSVPSPEDMRWFGGVGYDPTI
jgi:hypothetical protein